MKVAAVAHFYMPWRCAGSETVIHELMKAATTAGHETQSWCTHKDADKNWRGTEPDETLDGVLVHRSRNVLTAGQAVRRWRPDVILTHHDHATYSIKLAKTIGARSVYLVHNDMDLNQRPLRLRPDMVVMNSDWVADSLSRFGEPAQSMIFHPPLTPDRHVTDGKGDGLTLINLNLHKGSALFYELAERMPDRQFYGVIGGHGKQVIRRNLPNVEILEHGPDMKRVWNRTKVLLMPSVYESYGLTAVEAAINGIPTIANPTPGLVENLGAGGLFADRDDVAGWMRQISKLDNPDTYADASVYALVRAEDALKQTRDTLRTWVEWIGV